jgi:nucleoside diphosphate kinase
LTPSLAKALFESKVVKEFNRKNPKYSMTELNHISTQKVELLFKQYGPILEQIKESIREKITEKVLANTYLEEEDMYARIRALPKFLEWIDKRVWFLFFIIYQKEDLREQMLYTFQNMIYSYLEHTVIATHLSNLIMEFVQNAEKAHFELLATKFLKVPKSEADKFIRNRENRLKLKQLAIDQKQNLQISWNLNPEKLTSGHLSRLQIQISNYGSINEDLAQKLRRKMKADVDGISIASFYDDSDQEEGKLGAGLGLLYNSYLEQACKKEGIQYRCVIYPEPKTQKTTVKIDMTL